MRVRALSKTRSPLFVKMKGGVESEDSLDPASVIDEEMIVQ